MAYDQSLADALDEIETLRQELSEARDIADDAVRHLLAVGFYGLHRSREDELHAHALKLNERLKAVTK